MHSAFYVSLSSQLALEKRIATIAENVANAGTIGYRATGVSFDSVLSNRAVAHGRASGARTTYASAGADYISRESGSLVKTDNPFDVGLTGNAWLAIRTPQGVAYTRDGRMKMLETGELQTILGFPVLDAGGAPITLNPTGGPPMIFRDGMINQGDSQVGALGLFEIDDSTPLRRGENSSVIPAAPATPVVNFTRNGVVQGHVENANVNPVTEITKLILTQRAFEGAVGAYDLMDNAHRNAVKTLGGA